MSNKAAQELARKQHVAKVNREEHAKIMERRLANQGVSLDETKEWVYDKLRNLIEIPGIDQRHTLIEEQKLAMMPFLPGDHLNHEVIELHSKALLYLLECDYHLFWSHLIHNETVVAFLRSYLKYCPRPHDAEPTTSIYTEQHPHSVLHQRVFFVIHRAHSSSESKKFFMNKEYHYISTKKLALFTLPNILDIVTLYPKSKTMAKMLTGIFRSHNHLVNDTNNVAMTSKTVLEASVFKGVDKEHQLYVLDTLATVYSFLNSFSQAVTPFSKAGFFSLCAKIWTSGIDQLCGANLRRRIIGKRLALAIARRIFKDGIVARVYDRGTHKYKEPFGELLKDALDSVILSTEFKSFTAALNQQIDLCTLLNDLLSNGRGLNKDQVSNAAYLCSNLPPVAEESDELLFGAVIRILKAIPNASEPFVLKCFEKSDMDEAQVISMLQSGSLPEGLAELDWATGQIRVDSKGKGDEEIQPNNILDMPSVSVLLGKKDEIEDDNYGAPVEDMDIRSFISKYDYTYDDEYDDALDSVAMVQEAMTVDELEENDKTVEQSTEEMRAPNRDARPRDKGKGRGRTKKSHHRKDQHAKKRATFIK